MNIAAYTVHVHATSIKYLLAVKSIDGVCDVMLLLMRIINKKPSYRRDSARYG